MQVWWGRSLTLLYNDAAIRFLGPHHPSVIARSGRDWSDFAAALGPVLDKLHTDTSPTWCRDVRLLLGGTETFVTCSFSPILGATGDVLGVFCTLADSTESVVAKRRLDVLNAISVACATATIPSDVCRAFVDVMAKSADVSFAVVQLVDGTRCATGIDPIPSEITEAVVAALENDATADVALSDQRALALPIHSMDGVAGVLVCGSHASSHVDDGYHMFLDLVAGYLGGALADATARGTGDDVRRAAQAPAAGRPNDAFLAVLGHELRNPLSALMTTLQTMQLRAPSSEIELMERSVRQLSRVVDNLLDISRIARGKLELNAKRVELAQIVDRSMELVTALFTERKNQVFVRVPRIGLRLAVDGERIAQAIANLLTNASRFSEPGASIWIEAARVEGRVRISIRDEGSGIEPDRMKHVFEAFYQTPELRPRSAGLGLGLAIARSLVELHGGTLRIRSEGNGKGTECVIELPSEARPLAQPQSLPPATRKRLLLVEDNDDAARSLKGALEQLGYTVAVAHNAPIALNLARTFNPDVALLDIGLPVMDGWELARRLRAQRADRVLHVVAVTAYDQESHKRKSEEAGFADHLIKPIDLTKLEELVESLTDPPGAET